MYNRLSFDELLALLPSCPGPDALPTPCADLSLPGYVTSSLPEFVPPRLTELEATSPGRPQVVVLSAPGAVGKSTLAREVSYARKAPLWDLARYDSFARGTLVGALGPAFEFLRDSALNPAWAGY